MKKIYKKRKKPLHVIYGRDRLLYPTNRQKNVPKVANALKASRAYTYIFLSIQNTEHLESVY